MLVLAVLVLAGVVASILAVAVLLFARGRLAAELTAARGAVAVEQGARDEVKGLLDVSQEARLRAEEEAREAEGALRLELASVHAALEAREAALSLAAADARRAEEALAQERARALEEIQPLEREIARLVAESSAAEQRSRIAASERRSLEAEIAELTASSSAATQALTERAATLAAARAQAEEGTAQLAKRQQQLLAELDSAKRIRAEAEEAQRVAEEEARIARTSKESFAGEARLLREEILRVQAKLDQASRSSEGPPDPVSVKANELPLKHVITWWCVSCNEGGGPGPKPHVCMPSEKKK